MYTVNNRIYFRNKHVAVVADVVWASTDAWKDYTLVKFVGYTYMYQQLISRDRYALVQ